MSADLRELLELAAELDRASEELRVDDPRPVPSAPTPGGGDRATRVALDPDDVGRGLAQLVLTIVELLRQLMERQAIRRMEGGNLTDEQIERLGSTFMKLGQRMNELTEQFGLTAEDLNLDLGPLGRLM